MVRQHRANRFTNGHPKTVVVTTDLREKNEAEPSTYTPQVAVPDAEIADEIWRLQALLDEEDRSAFVTSRRIRFHVVLPHNNHHSLAQLPISRRFMATAHDK